MSPSKTNNQSTSSNRNGEVVGPQANILASCYVVDLTLSLAGFHYSTTGAGAHANINAVQGPSGFPEVRQSNLWDSPPSSPPLAALTTANELALFSKHPTQNREIEGRRKNGRRGGAAYTIRGECERLFCKTMKTVFLGEEGRAGNNSFIVMGANTHSLPDERLGAYTNYFDDANSSQGIDAWLEIWDYRGGCSFRGFVGGKGGGKSLFAFFDSSIIGRDLKQGFMALIELAETVFAVSQVVICLDRSLGKEDCRAFMKSLRWIGFELIALDTWANDLDVTSDKWMFLGMEI